MTPACADCRTEVLRREAYYIARPAGAGHPFYLCVKCWNRVVGLAVMAAIR